MKTTQSRASTRLFKKLSALRATLSNEERAILDNLINVEEVAAHRMHTKIASKANTRATDKASEVAAHRMNTKITSKANTKATDKAAEVAAHRMNTKITSKANTRASEKAAEVSAHKMNTKITSKATEKTTPRIVFDPQSEEYKITE